MPTFEVLSETDKGHQKKRPCCKHRSRWITSDFQTMKGPSARCLRSKAEVASNRCVLLSRQISLEFSWVLPSVCVCVCMVLFLFCSWSLRHPGGHRQRPSDRGELWLPRHGGVPVPSRLSTDRLFGSHLSPGQPVVRAASHLHT